MTLRHMNPEWGVSTAHNKFEVRCPQAARSLLQTMSRLERMHLRCRARGHGRRQDAEVIPYADPNKSVTLVADRTRLLLFA